VSGDRLAHIEEGARARLGKRGGATLEADDVLALVEIARAAQDTVDAYEADVAWEDLRVTELAAALARLDSGAAEGDT
jgi:hypothetical protein